MTDVTGRASPAVAARPASVSRGRRWVRAVVRPEVAMGVLLLVGAALVLIETRGTAPWFDEWSWIVHRRNGGLDTFLQPHNEHFVLVQVAIYRLLFATVGLQHSLPYRAVMVAAGSACVLLVFVYARRRVGGWAAVAAAALLLFLGPGWEVLLWPFEMGWLISVGAGLGVLACVDRRDRFGYIATAVLTRRVARVVGHRRRDRGRCRGRDPGRAPPARRPVDCRRAGDPLRGLVARLSRPQ